MRILVACAIENPIRATRRRFTRIAVLGCLIGVFPARRTLRAPQKPSCSQLLRGILVDHDVLHGGEALLDGIVGALGYRVGIHQS